MITIKLLSDRYRLGHDHMPCRLTRCQEEAKRSFLDEIHKKDMYITADKCPYCGDNRFMKISEIDGRGIPSSAVICEGCGGCFKNEILNKEGAKLYYEKISYLLRGKSAMRDDVEGLFKKRLVLFAYPRYRFVKNFIGLKALDGYVAEIGCNDGANLVPWHSEGFRVFGVEIDPAMAAFARTKGLDVIDGDFMERDMKMKPVLIILSHMLEHVMDLDAAIKRLSGIVRPGGYLFIEVPGARTHGSGDPLRYLDVEHNYNFDLGSLTRALEKNSFKILYGDEYVRVLCTSGDGSRFSLRQRRASSLNAAKAGILKTLIDLSTGKRKDLFNFLKKCESNKLKARFLSKLYDLYFRYYYASFVNESQAGGEDE